MSHPSRCESVPYRPVIRGLAILVVSALVAGCAGGSIRFGEAHATLSVRADLEPGSACVLAPDPSNGGHPDPPAAIASTGDSTDPTGAVAVTVVGLGDVVLPSDRLLVADFFVMNAHFLADMPAVDLDGFTGRAPVCLHIAQFQPPDQRAAFLHVRFTDAPVVRWAIGAAGFGVDGGTGGIASTEALRAVTADTGDAYLEAIEAHSIKSWGWANITTDAATGANVIGFSTGYGDGGYPVYAGFSEDGRIASVVIDLLVLPWRWLDRVGTVPPP